MTLEMTLSTGGGKRVSSRLGLGCRGSVVSSGRIVWALSAGRISVSAECGGRERDGFSIPAEDAGRLAKLIELAAASEDGSADDGDLAASFDDDGLLWVSSGQSAAVIDPVDMDPLIVWLREIAGESE